MWDTVVIGTGNSGTTAVKIFTIGGDHGISHNSTSYWISNCILNTGITIFKNTPEGEVLSDMINKRIDLEEIQEYIDSLILKNISVITLRNKISYELDKKFKEGKQAAKHELADWIRS